MNFSLKIELEHLANIAAMHDLRCLRYRKVDRRNRLLNEVNAHKVEI